MKTELQYRNFDDLMNTVRSDFYTYDQDNFINPQEFAERLNLNTNIVSDRITAIFYF